jgi:DNA replication and repair protein RecF
MRIDKLKLANFRNHSKREFGFGDPPSLEASVGHSRTVMVGKNGSGKSNILEAIYLLATGKSFRADKDNEMITYGEELAVVSCQLSANLESINLQVALNNIKHFEVNGVPRRMIDFAGRLKAVMFGPADMEIVTGSPSVRRKYLDFVISQTDREYHRCLMSYEKGLRQRNKLLDLIREAQADRLQLIYWDEILIKNGQYVTKKRHDFLTQVGYKYDKSEISEARLKQYEREEVAAGSTLVGPHRDDFVLMWERRDVAKFGSRGEQRMAVWWLKQKEIEYLGDTPVILLDDIFSELDHEHRDEVLDFTRKYPGQVIMTTADEHMVPEGWDIIRL